MRNCRVEINHQYYTNISYHLVMFRCEYLSAHQRNIFTNRQFAYLMVQLSLKYHYYHTIHCKIEGHAGRSTTSHSIKVSTFPVFVDINAFETDANRRNMQLQLR